MCPIGKFSETCFPKFVRVCKPKTTSDSICNLRALKNLKIGGCSNLEALPIGTVGH